jgi:hypothetical protein
VGHRRGIALPLGWRITGCAFLYGLGNVGLHGLAVIQPPLDHAPRSTLEAHERVRSWMEREGVDVVGPADLDNRGEQTSMTL